MKEYTVEITEVLQRQIKIKAESYEDAIYEAEEKYRNCEIILDAEDLKESSVEIIEE